MPHVQPGAAGAFEGAVLSLFRAVVLGLVQGLTEFLPISSTAHLILTSRLLGWHDQGIHFDMAANTGSLVAVMIYFRHEIARILRAWSRSLLRRPCDDRPAADLAWQLLWATVPAAAAGVLLQDFVATGGRRVGLIATTTILFGLLLGAADRWGRQRRGLPELGLRRALWIGGAQALALLPGTSRSGVTITAGLAAGLSREDAARFSFLLAIPIGVLVAGKDAFDLLSAGVVVSDWPAIAVGFAVSGLSAYAAIHWLLTWVRSQRLTLFVVYRVLLGLGLITLLAWGGR